VLVFISDLHFIDETAGQHNIQLSAFEGVFRDIRDYTEKFVEVKIVFLGDIFDLIRTTYWLDVPADQRPWGDTEGNGYLIEQHAKKIMDDLIAKNSNTLAFLKDGLKDVFGQDVEKIYIPGNHDRLCNVYEDLREKVRNTLGIPGGKAPFPHVYDDMQLGNQYKVFARHGHEYDPWNYEGTTNWNDSDYAQVPVGDLIACEVAARIPHTIMKNVDGSIPDDQKRKLLHNLQEVDNVRPFLSILHWLFYRVSENPSLKDVINASLAEIATNFQNLTYVNRWYKRHGKFLKIDMTDEVKALIEVFKHFNIDAAEHLADIFTKIFGSGGVSSPNDSDSYLTNKAVDFFTHTPDYRSIVMGHTHNPLQVPVRVTSEGLEQVYINTGTWRKRYIQGAVGGFVGVKYLTFAVFYRHDENPNQFFETWTGTLKEL